MADKMQQTIYDAITNSSDLKPGNYVSVTIKKTSLFGKKQVELTGRAATEADKTKIEEIAKGLAQGLEVVSNIRLSRTGG